MKYILPVCLILLIFTHTKAQNRQVTDSLLKQANQQKSAHKKYGIYIALGGEYVFTNADSAIYFKAKALDIAKQLNIDSLLANAYYAIASIEATRNHYEAALLNCDSAFKYFSRTGNTLALAMVRNVQGGVCMASGRNELASQMLFDAIEYTKRDTASGRILYTYHNLVLLLHNMDKNDKALEYAFKQYEWAKRLNIADEVAYACSNIADTYIKLKDSAKAIIYINELSQTAEQTPDPYLKVIGKNQMGMRMFIEKNYEESAKYFKQSLAINNNLVDQQLACFTLLGLGRVYQKMNQYIKADSCFLKVIDISRELDIKEERKSAYEMLSVNAVAQKDYKRAYSYTQALLNIRDSLLNEKTEHALADAEAKYNLSEKQQELELSQAEGKLQIAETARQKTGKLIILFCALGILVIAALLFNRYKLKKELEKHNLLLEERTRIGRELHDDLGGGLSTIRLMTEMVRDPQFGLNGTYLEHISSKSKELVQSMNEIVWSLNNNNDNMAGMLVYIRQYAASFMEDSNIRFHFSQPESIPSIEVDGHTRRHILLLLKEALHNVVKHSGASLLQLDIRIDNNLVLSIADNGKGLSTNKNKGSGNGLRNMQQRIDILKGNLQILQEGGTTVIFSVPLKSFKAVSI